MTVKGNTVAGCTELGLLSNNGHDISFLENTIFGNGVAQMYVAFWERYINVIHPNVTAEYNTLVNTRWDQ